MKNSSIFEIEANLLKLMAENNDLIGVLDLKSYYFSTANCRAYYEIMLELKSENRKVSAADVYLIMRENENDPVSIEASFKPDIDKSMALEYLKIVKENYVEREMVKAANELSPSKSIRRAKELEVELEEKEMLSFNELIGVYRENWEKKKERLANFGTFGLVTGFNFLDMGVVLEPSTLTVLAAMPSIGKTSLSLNIAANAAMFDQNVLYFSMEMDEGHMMDKLFSQIAGIKHADLRSASDDDLLENAISCCKPMLDRFKMVHLPRATSDDVCLVARKEALKKPVDLIVVDYLQYLRDPVTSGKTKAGVIGDMCKNFKALASETDSVVIVNAQFNRESMRQHGAIPKLHQLRDSGEIEQEADFVLILHRMHRDSKDAIVKAAKVRYGKAEGEYNLHFDIDISKFTEKPTQFND